MYMAAKNGHLEVVRVLARKGADLRQAAQSGKKPLDAAIEGCHFEVALLLHRIGAAGGWRKYVAGRRMEYVRIKYEVSRTYAVVPRGTQKQKELLHFVFGKNQHTGGGGGGGGSAERKDEGRRLLAKTGPPMLTIPRGRDGGPFGRVVAFLA